ncbi:hypothetical protein MBLNU457_1928t1 [Dothideomycetes sp. NU457]
MSPNAVLEMDDDQAYDAYIERMRETEYPMLKDAVYLDHAGTTLYSKRLMERFHQDMMTNLYGNPHSMSPSSHTSTLLVENVRFKLLRFLKADPDYFDVVFVANATAAIKLIADTFRDLPGGFWYGYHKDAHTSLVGARELARSHRCFETDREVEDWIKERAKPEGVNGLFAYPAQSNMDGRRLPLRWSHEMRQAENISDEGRTFTLLDAAALLSTSPLDLSDSNQAPDFTVLSLYKIFGFPDLGALIVRKDAGWVFQHRKYFGGGTVDMVLSLKEQWHAKKVDSIHSQLEDGTLPIHSITAFDSAFAVHTELFQSLARVARHTGYLADRLHEGLTRLRHSNGRPLVKSYKDDTSHHKDTCSQGPVVSFNLMNYDGTWVSNNEVEKLASIRNIHIRTGGLCNPGGIASALSLKPWNIKENFSAGHKCGSENDIVDGKPTGMIRASLGAMSTTSDVDRFLEFLREFFLHDDNNTPSEEAEFEINSGCELIVESLTVYPIKSCAGWQVPFDTPWLVRPEGLAWDREWCLVHQGTNKALSQKRYPKMALIKPSLDFDQGLLRIRLTDPHNPRAEEISVPLSSDPRPFNPTDKSQPRKADVCGDTFEPRMYASASLARSLSDFLGVPCQLARFPPMGSAGTSTRHTKTHLKAGNDTERKRPILLSNESPILTINRSSLNRLNEIIKADFGKAASPSVFRANIVLAEPWNTPSGFEQPYAEDSWTRMQIGQEIFEFLGGCRRCQMVCIDQTSSEKNEQPFVTLAKTRRFGGKVLFGVHTCLLPRSGASSATIRVGDVVTTFTDNGVL